MEFNNFCVFLIFSLIIGSTASDSFIFSFFYFIVYYILIFILHIILKPIVHIIPLILRNNFSLFSIITIQINSSFPLLTPNYMIQIVIYIQNMINTTNIQYTFKSRTRIEFILKLLCLLLLLLKINWTSLWFSDRLLLIFQEISLSLSLYYIPILKCLELLLLKIIILFKSVLIWLTSQFFRLNFL